MSTSRMLEPSSQSSGNTRSATGRPTRSHTSTREVSGTVDEGDTLKLWTHFGRPCTRQ